MPLNPKFKKILEGARATGTVVAVARQIVGGEHLVVGVPVIVEDDVIELRQVVPAEIGGVPVPNAGTTVVNTFLTDHVALVHLEIEPSATVAPVGVSGAPVGQLCRPEPAAEARKESTPTAVEPCPSCHRLKRSDRQCPCSSPAPAGPGPRCA